MTETERALRMVDQLLAECRTASAVGDARRAEVMRMWDSSGTLSDLVGFAEWSKIMLATLAEVSDKQTAAIETLALVTKAVLDRLDDVTQRR